MSVRVRFLLLLSESAAVSSHTAESAAAQTAAERVVVVAVPKVVTAESRHKNSLSRIYSLIHNIYSIVLLYDINSYDIIVYTIYIYV